MIGLILGVAFAGYGDAVDGHPTWAERDLHRWTNAVRVAPDAFAYPCDPDAFREGERTPKPPLRWNADLARAARAHTVDMATHGFVDHPSSDGTSFVDRLDRYYDGVGIGENVAMTSRGAEAAVLDLWMCSATHRANLMDPDYDELGTGAVDDYWTQDFGERGVGPRPLSMGLHLPAAPGDRVELRVDWHASDPPGALVAVLDGRSVELEHVLGAPESGVYAGAAAVGPGCHAYFFRGFDGAREIRFPETGRYGWGDCAWDDPEAQWLAGQELPGAELPTGCTTGGSAAVGWALLLLPWIRRRPSGRR